MEESDYDSIFIPEGVYCISSFETEKSVIMDDNAWITSKTYHSNVVVISGNDNVYKLNLRLGGQIPHWGVDVEGDNNHFISIRIDGMDYNNDGANAGVMIQGNNNTFDFIRFNDFIRRSDPSANDSCPQGVSFLNNPNNKTILGGVTTYTHDQSQTIDTNNGYGIKNTKFEEAQKNKERLNALFNEKIKDSQKISERINEFEKKNKILEQKINKYKEDNDNLASTLDKVIKLMKLLKNSGFDVAEILNNLSAYDDEESDGSETKKKDEDGKSVSSFKDYSIKMGEDIDELDLNEDENDTDLIKCHENFKQSKMNIKDGNDIPKLNIKKIISNKNKKNGLKQQEDFSFKNNKKIMSHSVGD